jgi:GntR family transcriptional regulator
MTGYRLAKYFIIEQDIIDLIKKGELKPGDKVDSESVLKKKYNVSTITVRKAFTDLINEGYLYGVQGAGTFVAKKQMIRGLTSISFSDELRQQGYKIGMQIDTIDERINEKAAEALGLRKTQPLICVCRVRLANNEPIAYHISYMSKDMISVEQMQALKQIRSFYKVLNKYGIYPKWATENYSVKDITDTDIAKRLNVKKGSAAFFVKRVTYDECDRTIEYAETYFNKDWYSVTVDIKC